MQSFDRGNDCARSYDLSDGKIIDVHGSAPVGPDRVFHLHRFQDHNHIAFVDCVPVVDRNRHNGSLHRSDE